VTGLRQGRLGCASRGPPTSQSQTPATRPSRSGRDLQSRAHARRCALAPSATSGPVVAIAAGRLALGRAQQGPGEAEPLSAAQLAEIRADVQHPDQRRGPRFRPGANLDRRVWLLPGPLGRPATFVSPWPREEDRVPLTLRAFPNREIAVPAT